MANIKATYKRYTGSQWDVIHFETTTAQVARVKSTDSTNYPASDQFVTGSILEALKSYNGINSYLKLDPSGFVDVTSDYGLKFKLGSAYFGIDESAAFELSADGGSITTPVGNSLSINGGALYVNSNLITNTILSNSGTDLTLSRANEVLLTLKKTGSNPHVEVATNVKIQQSTAPTADNDLTNKKYVDMVAGYGMNPLLAARAATTANITLSSTQTVDGVSLAVGDRVLVKNQTDAKNNGVYIVAAAAWTRAADANSPANLSGALISINEGVENKRQIYYQKEEISTVGTSNQTWILFANTADYYTTGTNGGLTLSGNAFSISGKGVTTAMIADGAVTAPQLGASAVETAKIKDANVTAPKIADDAVETTKIKNANVTTVKIADANVTPAKLSATFGVTDAGVAIPGAAVSAATLLNILDYFAKQFTNVTGETAWRTAPSISLKGLNTGKQNKIYYQTDTPAITGMVAGDIWIDITV